MPQNRKTFKQGHIPKSLRKKIFERTKFCVECGDKNNLTLDHIVPLSKGGRTTEANLQVLCRWCNLKKDDN